MAEQEGGWDDLWSDPAPDSPPIVERIDWAGVTQALDAVIQPELDRLVDETLASVQPDPEEQPRADETSAQESSDGLTLFGDPDQFHIAWQHWNGMPEFHMDDLKPESELVVKFKTAEDRAAFAKLLGREIRKEESRGIWYPKIEIAHFWDKRYRDAAATPVDDSPVLSEADEVDDTAETEETA